MVTVILAVTGKSLFSILDQKRAKAVEILQERCTFPSNEAFINALEYNAIAGVDFRRRNVKTANKIYGYSKGAADGKFKRPQKEIKMDRTSDDVAAPVPLKIMEHYEYILLDLALLFVNTVALLLAISSDIGFICCKAILPNPDKRVMNGLKSIILDYEGSGFKVIPAFTDGVFKPTIDWMRQELQVDLTICAADSHVLRAENATRFVKERVRCIQSESPFKRYPKRLTLEMARRVIVLINSFTRKLGVHSVMSSRQILFGKKFKISLCRIGDFVITYDVKVNNKTSLPKAFYVLYSGPSDSGTSHIIFKISKKECCYNTKM